MNTVPVISLGELERQARKLDPHDEARQAMLALVKLAESVLACEEVWREIERVDPAPGSERAVELGGKSIAAWQAVEAAMKAFGP